MEVNVPDNKAHAWVEVYKENFGWMPYEMTYYNSRESKEAGEQTLRKEKTLRRNKIIISVIKKIGMISLAIIVVSIVLIIVGLVRLGKKKKLRRWQFNNEDKAKAIYYVYNYICDVMGFLGIKKQKDMTIDEFFADIVERGICDEQNIKKIANRIKKAAYSDELILDEDLNYIKTQVENIVKIQYNGLGLKDKIRFKLIYNL